MRTPGGVLEFSARSYPDGLIDLARIAGIVPSGVWTVKRPRPTTKKGTRR